METKDDKVKTTLPAEVDKPSGTQKEVESDIQLLKPGTPEVRFGSGKKQGKDGCGY